MKTIRCNPFERFAKDWALLTAGDAGHYNSMTISWGAMGTVWGRSAVTVYVRPDRHTWSFLKDHDTFTVSFYPEEYRGALELMGSMSGRDGDKAAAAGLTPRPIGDGVTYAEAEETLVCRKMYMDQMRYEAVPQEAKKIYTGGVEPHYIIIGELIDAE